MVWEFIFGLTEQDMMDFGKTASVMDSADTYMLMAMYMRATGFKIKSMALVSKD